MHASAYTVSIVVMGTTTPAREGSERDNTMTTTMIRTLERGIGYSGKHGEKCWIARILGSDATYGLSRDFLTPATVKRDRFSARKYTLSYSYELEMDGLYELSADGARWFAMCFRATDGEVKTAKVSDARIKAWVAALDAGMSDADARRTSKEQA